jgi:hypothetical protein
MVVLRNRPRHRHPHPAAGEGGLRSTQRVVPRVLRPSHHTAASASLTTVVDRHRGEQEDQDSNDDRSHHGMTLAIRVRLEHRCPASAVGRRWEPRRTRVTTKHLARFTGLLPFGGDGGTRPLRALWAPRERGPLAGPATCRPMRCCGWSPADRSPTALRPRCAPRPKSRGGRKGRPEVEHRDHCSSVTKFPQDLLRERDGQLTVRVDHAVPPELSVRLALEPGDGP